MPAEKPALSRDAWVAEFVSELIRLRPDLTYSFKYATAVAAKQWNQRVKSARP
jgi:hypothetical protein